MTTYAAPLLAPTVSVTRTLKEKLSTISGLHWRGLQKAFRGSDRSRRGLLEARIFAIHLAEYGIQLTQSELDYLVITMGHNNFERSSTSKLSSSRSRSLFHTRPSTALSQATSRSSRRDGKKYVRYAEFMKKFLVSSKSLSKSSARKALQKRS